MNGPFNETSTSFPMRAEAVNFRNGMIVTADDLSAAMRYPVALMQAVNVAVYGCGVVCGFPLAADPELCGRTGRCDPCDDDSPETFPNFVVEVGRGTAIDCHGLPIELCGKVRVSIEPEICGGEVQPGEVCILIRRREASGSPRGDCYTPAGEGADCARLRDHVEIRAFPSRKLPEHTCLRGDPPGGSGGSGGCGCSGGRDPATDNANRSETAAGIPGAGAGGSDADSSEHRRWAQICRRLVECDPCTWCGEGWVLIGCVSICKGGIVRESLKDPYGRRRWIKPIEALCRREPEKNTADTAQPAGDRPAGEVRSDTITAETFDENPEIAFLMHKDPDFDAQMSALVESEGHRKVFRAARIGSLDHLAWYIATNRELLSGLVQFARNPEKLDVYLAAARSGGRPRVTPA